MEDKISAAPFVAPTIRTTDPNISIVMAPTNKSRTDVYLFRYYQQVFSFLTPSPARSLHDSSYEDLRERNSHLNLAIDSFGESVEWSEIIVDPISGSPKRKYSPVQVSKSFSSFEEQKVVMGLFCELLAWACDGSLAMIRGGYLISKAEFVKKECRVRP